MMAHSISKVCSSWTLGNGNHNHGNVNDYTTNDYVDIVFVIVIAFSVATAPAIYLGIDIDAGISVASRAVICDALWS